MLIEEVTNNRDAEINSARRTKQSFAKSIENVILNLFQDLTNDNE